MAPAPLLRRSLTLLKGTRESILQPAPHGTVRGLLGVAVSRLDNPTPERVAQKSSWMPPSVVIQRAGTFALEDKEQIWADNAASSPFFGHVYTCNVEFRAQTGGAGAPVPVMVASSADGGSTWTQRKLPGNPGAGFSFLKFGFISGCTIRTDSHGVVYLFYANFMVGLPGNGFHVMLKSFDGGKHWTKPQRVLPMNDMRYQVDPVEGRCVIDGYAGARIDLSAAPSVDIANGAQRPGRDQRDRGRLERRPLRLQPREDAGVLINQCRRVLGGAGGRLPAW
jgi:hypothetical protein